MRISVNKDDVGYRPDAHHFTATLDGVDMSTLCFTADEEKGEVHLLRKDSRGLLIMDKSNYSILTEIKKGVVKITKKENT